LLAGDRSGLTADTGFVSESTWADRYRDSDRDSVRTHYEQTRRWHYIDLERRDPQWDAACFQHPALEDVLHASSGPAADCVVDKIEQFEFELRQPRTTLEERRLALQFLLHLLADLHQPLHAIDDQDQGGNRKQLAGHGAAAGSLHHYWDVELVRSLGSEPAAVAASLRARISAAQRRRWSRGSVAAWAEESFAAGNRYAYEPLGFADGSGRYVLSGSYIEAAQLAVATQLSRAGVRLAVLLNRTLGVAPAPHAARQFGCRRRCAARDWCTGARCRRLAALCRMHESCSLKAAHQRRPSGRRQQAGMTT
jgi:hypothetical protein